MELWVWGQPGLLREESQGYTEKSCLGKPIMMMMMIFNFKPLLFVCVRAHMPLHTRETREQPLRVGLFLPPLYVMDSEDQTRVLSSDLHGRLFTWGAICQPKKFLCFVLFCLSVCLWQGLTVQPWLSWNSLYRLSWPRICLIPPTCILNAGIKGGHHHSHFSWRKYLFEGVTEYSWAHTSESQLYFPLLWYWQMLAQTGIRQDTQCFIGFL